MTLLLGFFRCTVVTTAVYLKLTALKISERLFFGVKVTPGEDPSS